MVCKECNKILSAESALHCEGCGGDYCENCANTLGVCGCFSDLKHYN